MAVKNYYSFGGEILAEETGGVRRDYLTDAHGSVTATVTGAGAIENTYRYKPYGETLAKTGAASDPNFLWSGTWGYRVGSAAGTAYVRARTYHQGTGRWTSEDPIGLWGGLNLYTYCDDEPITAVDPAGLKPPKKKPGKKRPRPLSPLPDRQDQVPLTNIGIGNALVILNDHLGVCTDGSGSHSDGEHKDTTALIDKYGHYMNSDKTHYVVIWDLSSHLQSNSGIHLGDIGVFVGKKPIGFVVGDTGHSLIGEASTCLISDLGGKPMGGNNSLNNPPVSIVFPGSYPLLGGQYNNSSKIQSCAIQLLNDWLKDPNNLEKWPWMPKLPGYIGVSPQSPINGPSIIPGNPISVPALINTPTIIR